MDEADSLHDATQQAIRRIVELYSRTTRFVFVCKTSLKLIEPLQGRCAIVRRSKLGNNCIESRMVHVCELEKVCFTKEGLEAIVFTANGDMRAALNNLQSTHAGMGTVDDVNVFRLCDAPRPDTGLGILNKCVDKDHRGSMGSIKRLKSDGYSSHDIVGTFFRVCKEERLFVVDSTRMRCSRKSPGHTSVTRRA